MSEFDWRNPDYLAELKRRNDLLVAMRSDTTGKVAAALYKKYQTDYVAFVNDWLFTYDPRRVPAVIPFRLFPKQAEFFRWLDDRRANKESGIAEKSRDMGVTWLCVAYSVCMWIFEDGTKVGFGSRKEDMVDRLGDMDSIFEKIRFALRYIPVEFMPAGYVERVHAPHMKIVNPETLATITGEAGDNIGRGGRNSIYFKDESAFYERPMRIEAALSQNSDVKIDVSTPNGTGNPFYQKRVGGALPVFTFHWKDDPRKDDEWYQKQRRELDPIVIAQEVDIDYQASAEGICIPAKWVRAAVGLELEDTGELRAGFDVADESEGGDKNALGIAKGVVVQSVTAWGGLNTTQSSRRVWQTCKMRGVSSINFDSIGVGAGVRGEMASLKQADSSYDPVVRPINVGDSCTPGMFEGSKCSNKDTFINLKAQLWWQLRRRFEKVYEHVNGIATYPHDELISIPNDPELIAELSQPRVEVTESGLIQIESKKKMKARGIKSPNKADAVVLLFMRPRLIMGKT